MRLDSLLLGAPLPSHSSACAFEDDLDGLPARFEITLDQGRVTMFEVKAGAAFEILASAYDRIDTTLRARHGDPSYAPAHNDGFRELAENGWERPNDRYGPLRERGWKHPDIRLELSVVPTCAYELVLRAKLDATT